MRHGTSAGVAAAVEYIQNFLQTLSNVGRGSRPIVAELQAGAFVAGLGVAPRTIARENQGL